MGKRAGRRGPADNAPRIGDVDDDPRRVYLDHATDIGAYNPCFPEYSVRSSRRREGRRPGRLPAGLRGATRTGARRLSRRLLRLRHPASQLRHGAVRQDAVAARDLPPAHAAADRAAASTSSGARRAGHRRRRRGCCSTTKCCAPARSTPWRREPDKLAGYQIRQAAKGVRLHDCLERTIACFSRSIMTVESRRSR